MKSHGDRAVGEFVRIDPRGKTDRQLLIAALKQAEATHGCLETHIRATEAAHEIANEKREALGRQVEDIATTVGTLNTRQTVTEGSVSALAKALGGQLQTGTVKIKADMGWRGHLKIAGTILGALGGAVLAYQILWPGIVAIHAAILAAHP